ncbi:MAG TPA: 4Fe-4S dicluster domain-containing protein [Candidatus Acidoferrum sp.]|nr:4Fe-4S dicluster domain-containing protein [Candidatus Acidoferrum sp.]
MKTMLLYFSPTHTTRRVLRAIAEGVGRPYTQWDVTLPADRARFMQAPPPIDRDTLVLLGAPVYGGLISAAFLPVLTALHGNGAPCVPVCLYGNRSYDEALRQMYGEACKAGFVPVAAAAFVGEHSFTSEIAAGRPNQDDIAQARAFGAELGRREEGGLRPLKEEDVPWHPRDAVLLGRHRHNLSEVGPAVCAERCVGCGSCVGACPTATLRMAPGSIAEVAGDTCIKCRACARICPTEAIDLDDPLFYETVEDCVASFGSPDCENTCFFRHRDEPDF